MISVRRMVAAVALVALSGCAAMDGPVEAASTCHTNSGEWVRTSQPCTITYSSSRTVSSTTTTTTTTTTDSAPANGDDGSRP